MNNTAGAGAGSPLAVGLTSLSLLADQDAALAGRYPLVYITPEKLLSGATLQRLAAVKHKIALVAIDEAHWWGLRDEEGWLGRGHAKVGILLTATFFLFLVLSLFLRI